MLVVAVALAQWAILIGPAVLAILWLAGTEADRAATVATGLAGCLALALAAAISTLVDAPRPFVDAGAFNYLAHVRDGSFPSDHATLAFAIAIGLCLHRPPTLPWVWLLLLAVAAAVGWARIFLGAHYPSDIAGGALVAVASVVTVATPAGRAASRPLQSFAESVRARVVVEWRRIRPGRPSPGATEP